MQPVAGKLNWHLMIVAGLQVIHPNIHLMLVNHLAVPQRRPAHIVILELGQALYVAAIGVHRGEVGAAPTVRDEIDAPVCGPHGEGILPVVVGDFSKRERIKRADIDLLGLAALVAFPIVELETDLLHRNAFAVRLVADPSSGLEGDHLRQTALRRDLV